ncbi:MAG TPA: hypothetical protein VF461_13435 [Gemmatimonadaceae bacterium]
MRNLKLGSAVATCASIALVVACSNGGDSSRFAAPTGLRADVVPSTGSAGIATLCKNGPAGTYTFTVTNSGTTNAGDVLVAAPSITVVTPGTPVCTDVYTRTTGGSSDAPAILAIVENAAPGTDLQSITLSGPGAQAGSVDVPGRKATVYINKYHGDVASFVNVAVAPPPVCDFITFGRLVATVNGVKVVVSGNIGGNQPGGGILSEFHVEANGVDNHVANVDTYGPIASGPLSSLTNSRISTGTAKNGVAVEVRMWDGGEPGKGTDILYVKLNGVELLGPSGAFIDQGNMQYHSNCRGPG